MALHMALYDDIDRNLKAALKSGDKITLSTMRMVRSALKLREVELRRKLDDAEVLRVLTSQVKQRRDSIEQFRQGGREDLARQEEAEIGALDGLMPKQLGPDEVEREVEAVIAEEGAAGPKDMGRVMKAAMSKLSGRADGKLVSELVKSKLLARLSAK
jgi:uncharacterized protein YqeY